MTLRIRHHLALPPLFAGLAAAAFALALAVHRRELAWVLAEEAQGRALCLAAFLDGAPTGPASTACREAAARLSAAAGGLTVHWFEPDGRGWRADPLHAEPGLRAAPAPDGEALRRLRRGEPAALQRRRPDAGFDESVGYAPVLGRDGGLRAVVGVTGRETITRTTLDEVRRTGGGFAAALLAAGFVVAELLARRVRRDLAGLAAGAAALARGDYAFAWPASAVRELDDLARTLESIARILRDGERRARHRFLGAVPSPAPEDLAAAARGLSVAPPSRPGNGAPPCVVRRLGGTDDDFWAVRRTPTAWHLVAGRLRAAAATEPGLVRLTRAEAAGDFLGGRLETLGPADAWRDLDALFPVERGMSLSIVRGRPTPVVCVHGPGPEPAPEPPPALPAGSPNRDGLAVLGTIEPDALRFADGLLRRPPRHPPEQAADQLAALLAGRSRGLLIIAALPATPP